jgi:hypothetical protein
MEFNMQLKYVGDLPIVSKGGVGFDHTRPDKYTYLQAAAELLEALSYGETETTQHLYNVESKTHSEEDLYRLLNKHIKDMSSRVNFRNEKAQEYVNELIQRVESNDNLTYDEKRAWLGNIALMKNYFVQYIINQTVYEEALNALSDEIHMSNVKEITVPMFKNYAIVLNELSEVLEKRKAPIDSELEIKEEKEKLIAKLLIRHP